VSVPADATITVSLEHDRSAFGDIKGNDKVEEQKAGVTPGGRAN
jgi:hypothetical protein